MSETDTTPDADAVDETAGMTPREAAGTLFLHGEDHVPVDDLLSNPFLAGVVSARLIAIDKSSVPLETALRCGVALSRWHAAHQAAEVERMRRERDVFAFILRNLFRRAKYVVNYFDPNVHGQRVSRNPPEHPRTMQIVMDEIAGTMSNLEVNLPPETVTDAIAKEAERRTLAPFATSPAPSGQKEGER